MKLKKDDLKKSLSLLNLLSQKDQIVTISSKDKRLNLCTKKEGSRINVRTIKIDEDFKNVATIDLSFLNNIERKAVEEFDLKINEKTITTKIEGILHKTAILDEEKNIEIKDSTEKDNSLKITEAIIVKLKKSIFFLSKDEKKNPILLGLNLKREKNELSISATDSYKMYTTTIENEGNDFNITIKKETIDALILLSEMVKGKPFEMYIEKNKVVVNISGLYYESNLIEGNYPNIKVAAEKNETQLTRGEIEITEEIIKKTKAIENRKAPRIEISRKENILTFATKTEIDSSEFKVESKGEVIEIRLTYENFLNMIENKGTIIVKEKSIMLKTKDEIFLLMIMVQ
jgi:DNA polymerase III sliding clamp (beta) subunit (PCNA family)